jgi:hypothetical protein
MKLGREEDRLEARLDAMGRSLGAGVDAAPAAFLGAVRRRRRAVRARRAGTAGAAVLGLAVLLMLARQRPSAAAPERVVASTPPVAPTFVELRSVADVDASAPLAAVVAAPIPCAGERPDSEVARSLAEFR